MNSCILIQRKSFDFNFVFDSRGGSVGVLASCGKHEVYRLYINGKCVHVVNVLNGWEKGKMMF